MTPTPPRFQDLCALVLAAGKGTRMHSRLPKVLREILGQPMLGYVYDALGPLFGAGLVTVVGYGAEDVVARYPDRADSFALQEQQHGTGHAVQVAWERVCASGARGCVVVNGDTPLLDTEAVARFARKAQEADATVGFMTITPADPAAFGRVLRDDRGEVTAIVEFKDYDTGAHGSDSGEVNAGIYYLDVATAGPLLDRLSSDNAAGELYLTDLVAHARDAGLRVYGHRCGDDVNLLGVNSPAELIAVEEELRTRIIDHHLFNGVVLHTPQAMRIGPHVSIAPGAELTGPCELLGRTTIASGVTIGMGCHIVDSQVEEGASVHAFSHVQGALVGPGAQAGPYVRLRPGAQMGEQSRAGNFVEIKKSTLGPGAKASHLTYLGDANVGPGVNIGAGTITCNYDGVNKHTTIIEEGAFIGSNTALVAPVTIGAGALVGAGSTITHDVSSGMLSLTRAEQRTVARKPLPEKKKS